jgi:hypothetical protein
MSILMQDNMIMYPYSLLAAPLLRQLIFDKKYNIISAIMPGGWYEEGIDASSIDESEKIGVPISKNFEKQLDNCATVLWADYNYGQNTIFFTKVIDKIKIAINKNKNIICCQKLDKNILNELINLADCI